MKLRLALGALVAGALMLNVGDALAQQTAGTYASLSAGLTFNRDIEGDVEGVEVTGEYDNPGYAIWAALGYRFGNGFRAEVELGYGRIEAESVSFLGVSVPVDGTTDLFSGTINGFYDFNVGGVVTPYIGGGVGVLHSSVDEVTATVGSTTITAEGDDSTDLTAFAEAGVAVSVAQQLELVPAYRFQWVNNGEDGFDDDMAHVVKVGLRYTF